jgi:hypothetical protein
MSMPQLPDEKNRDGVACTQAPRQIDYREKQAVKEEKQLWLSQRCFPGCVLEVMLQV